MAKSVKRDIFPIVFVSVIVLSFLILLYFITVNLTLRGGMERLDTKRQADIKSQAEAERQRARKEFQEKYQKQMESYQETYQELEEQKGLKKTLEAE